MVQIHSPRPLLLGTNNLRHVKERKTAWCKTRTSAVQFDSRPTALDPPFSWS